MIFAHKKKLIAGLFIVLLLISIPLTLSLLSKPQEKRTRASGSTSLYFTPSSDPTTPIAKNVGDTIPLDLMVDPGTNLVTFVKYQVTYDPTKIQIDTTSPMTLNNTVFSSVEGPVTGNGMVAQSVSIGSDPTKAIQKVTKVGTLNFKAVGTTNGAPTTVTFSTTTQALSAGQTDQASQNVLSTSTPANIIINSTTSPTSPPAPGCDTTAMINFYTRMTGTNEVPANASQGVIPITITGPKPYNFSIVESAGIQLDQITSIRIHDPALAGQTAPATITLFDSSKGTFVLPYHNNALDTMSDSVIADMLAGKAYVEVTTLQHPNGELRGQLSCYPAPSPTLTPLPTLAPLPTLTGTSLSFTVVLHGVGSGGDNPNPTGNSLSNKNPLHPQRNLSIQIINTNNTIVADMTAPITYDGGTGTFVGQVSVPGTVPPGNYSLKLKTDRYLRRLVPGIIQIKANIQNVVPSTGLVAGDTDGDNFLNVIDYNALLDCGYGLVEPLPMTDPNSAFNSKNCQVHTPVENLDIDDNGIVNSFDYNLFLRELSVQNGD